jgi:hypothetical protein
MKRKNLYTYIQALAELADLKGVKFAYAVIKNKKKIEEEIKIIEETIKPSDDFSKYEQERIQICVVNSEKKEDGSAVIVDNKYKIIDMEKFNTELEELRSNYTDTIKDRESQIADYNNLLEEDLDMTFFKIGENDLPLDITPAQLLSIEFMVNID